MIYSNTYCAWKYDRSLAINRGTKTTNSSKSYITFAYRKNCEMLNGCSLWLAKQNCFWQDLQVCLYSDGLTWFIFIKWHNVGKYFCWDMKCLWYSNILMVLSLVTFRPTAAFPLIREQKKWYTKATEKGFKIPYCTWCYCNISYLKTKTWLPLLFKIT